eukprot:g11387.t1
MQSRLDLTVVSTGSEQRRQRASLSSLHCCSPHNGVRLHGYMNESIRPQSQNMQFNAELFLYVDDVHLNGCSSVELLLSRWPESVQQADQPRDVSRDLLLKQQEPADVVRVGLNSSFGQSGWLSVPLNHTQLTTLCPSQEAKGCELLLALRSDSAACEATCSLPLPSAHDLDNHNPYLAIHSGPQGHEQTFQSAHGVSAVSVAIFAALVRRRRMNSDKDEGNPPRRRRIDSMQGEQGPGAPNDQSEVVMNVSNGGYPSAMDPNAIVEQLDQSPEEEIYTTEDFKLPLRMVEGKGLSPAAMRDSTMTHGSSCYNNLHSSSASSMEPYSLHSSSESLHEEQQALYARREAMPQAVQMGQMAIPMRGRPTQHLAWSSQGDAWSQPSFSRPVSVAPILTSHSQPHIRTMARQPGFVEQQQPPALAHHVDLWDRRAARAVRMGMGSAPSGRSSHMPLQAMQHAAPVMAREVHAVPHNMAITPRFPWDHQDVSSEEHLLRGAYKMLDQSRMQAFELQKRLRATKPAAAANQSAATTATATATTTTATATTSTSSSSSSESSTSESSSLAVGSSDNSDKSSIPAGSSESATSSAASASASTSQSSLSSSEAGAGAAGSKEPSSSANSSSSGQGGEGEGEGESSRSKSPEPAKASSSAPQPANITMVSTQDGSSSSHTQPTRTTGEVEEKDLSTTAGAAAKSEKEAVADKEAATSPTASGSNAAAAHTQAPRSGFSPFVASGTSSAPVSSSSSPSFSSSSSSSLSSSSSSTSSSSPSSSTSSSSTSSSTTTPTPSSSSSSSSSASSSSSSSSSQEPPKRKHPSRGRPRGRTKQAMQQESMAAELEGLMLLSFGKQTPVSKLCMQGYSHSSPSLPVADLPQHSSLSCPDFTVLDPLLSAHASSRQSSQRATHATAQYGGRPAILQAHSSSPLMQQPHSSSSWPYIPTHNAFGPGMSEPQPPHAQYVSTRTHSPYMQPVSRPGVSYAAMQMQGIQTNSLPYIPTPHHAAPTTYSTHSSPNITYMAQRSSQRPQPSNYLSVLPPQPTTGLKISCSVCGNQFKSKFSRDRHMKTHLAEVEDRKIGACHLCGREYTEIGNLCRHLRKNHGIEPTPGARRGRPSRKAQEERRRAHNALLTTGVFPTNSSYYPLDPAGVTATAKPEDKDKEQA